LNTIKLKNRSDLLQFAAKNRGCLAAQFLISVHNALSKGDPADSKSMMNTDLVRWASDQSGLKEIRDLREVQTLCLALQRMGAGRMSEAADVLAQRVKAVLSAKAAKGSWEKGQQIELLPVTGAAVVTASELALTGLGV